MSTAEVAYIRVSTAEQNPERQLAGMKFDKIFEDSCSGKSSDRPSLTQCLEYVREGDTLHIHSIDRLARNLCDLQRIVTYLREKKVTVHFHHENIIFTPKADNPMGNLLFQILGSFAEFERRIILSRQREGIALAKIKGVYKGQKNKLTSDKVNLLIQRHQNGVKASKLASEFGISRASVYNYLKRSR